MSPCYINTILLFFKSVFTVADPIYMYLTLGWSCFEDDCHCQAVCAVMCTCKLTTEECLYNGEASYLSK